MTHHAATDGKFGDALWRLEECERRFARETPFAFYAWLLGGDGGRQRILRRLGHEANDALDEFLELALGYERKAPASLQGFMAWLRAADTEVKRDMEISRDEVRVMTVHGAKGLEAPVVFLVDTATSPSDTQRLRLIRLPRGNAAPNAPGVVVWAGKKADDPAGVAAARTAMLGETEDEYRRLLYVAMTRAADRLIVGGCMPGNMNTIRKSSWYDLIAKGLDNSGLHLQEIEASGGGVVKRYSRPEDAAASDQAPPRLRTRPRRSRCRHGCIRRPRRRRPPNACCGRPIPLKTRVTASEPANPFRPAPAPCSAARWCTGCCNRCPMSPPTAATPQRWPISPAMPAGGPTASAGRWPNRS